MAQLNANSQFVVRDLVADQEILKLDRTTNNWYHAEFSPDHRTVAICTTEGPLLFWDMIERRAPVQVRGHKLRVGAMRFSNDGTLLASAGSDGTVRLWDPRAHRELATLLSGADAFWSVTISPDKRRAAAGTGQGTIVLWDCITHEHLATLKGHTTGFIGTVAFTPDGNTLISAAKDAVRFWRAATLAEADKSR